MTIYVVTTKTSKKDGHTFEIHEVNCDMTTIRNKYKNNILQFGQTYYVIKDIKAFGIKNNSRIFESKPAFKIYHSFSNEYFQKLRQFLTYKVTDPTQASPKPQIVAVGATAFLLKLTNNTLQTLDPNQPEDGYTQFSLKIKNLFTGYDRHTDDIKSSTADIETIMNGLAFSQGRQSYAFLEYNYLKPDVLSPIMKDVYQILLENKASVDEICKDLHYYQTHSKTVTELFNAPNSEIPSSKIDEVEDNVYKAPSDKTLETIASHLKQLNNNSEKKTAYYTTVLNVIKKACTAYLTSEYVFGLLLKHKKPNSIIAVKNNPNNYCNGSSIIISVICSILAKKTQEIKESIKTHGLSLFSKTINELCQGELDALKTLSISVQDRFKPVRQCLTESLFETEVFSKYHFDKTFTFTPTIDPAKSKEIYICMCINDLLAPSSNNLVSYKKKREEEKAPSPIPMGTAEFLTGGSDFRITCQFFQDDDSLDNSSCTSPPTNNNTSFSFLALLYNLFSDSQEQKRLTVK